MSNLLPVDMLKHFFQSNGKESNSLDPAKRPKTFRGSFQSRTDSFVGSPRGSILRKLSTLFVVEHQFSFVHKADPQQL